MVACCESCVIDARIDGYHVGKVQDFCIRKNSRWLRENFPGRRVIGSASKAVFYTSLNLLLRAQFTATKAGFFSAASISTMKAVFNLMANVLRTILNGENDE